MTLATQPLADALVDRCRSSSEVGTYWAGIKGLKDEHDIIDWSPDFIVFFNEDVDREIDWDTSNRYDDEIKKDATRLAKQNAILADAAILEAKDCTPFGRAAREWFRYLLGKAYVFTFQGDSDGAKKALLAAEQFFAARSKEQSRSWYLTSAAACTAPFLLAGALIWFERFWFIGSLGQTVFSLLLFLVAGALGALLSVIARSGQLDFDASAGLWLHFLEAASRIAMGALSGVVVGLAVKSGLFFETLTKGPETRNSIFVLAAFAAGASERMLGSIISKFDQDTPSKTKAS